MRVILKGEVPKVPVPEYRDEGAGYFSIGKGRYHLIVRPEVGVLTAAYMEPGEINDEAISAAIAIMGE